MLSLQMLLIQLRPVFCAVSFGKLWKLLNQKKVCFPLHSKKVLCIRVRTLLYITAKKIFLFFCLFINNFVYICIE